MIKKLLDFSNIDQNHYTDFCLYFLKEPSKINQYKSNFSQDFSFYLLNSAPEKFINYFIDDLLKLDQKYVILNFPYFITKLEHVSDDLLEFYIKNNFPKEYLRLVQISDTFLDFLCNNEEMFVITWRYIKNFNINYIKKIIQLDSKNNNNYGLLLFLRDNNLNQNLFPFQVIILEHKLQLLSSMYKLSKEAQEYVSKKLKPDDIYMYKIFIKKITESSVFWNCYNQVIIEDKNIDFLNNFKDHHLYNNSAHLIDNIIKNNE